MATDRTPTDEGNKPDPAERVMVWPHLLRIELVAALVFTLGLLIMSIVFRAPLLELADPQHTPNPSKAPWYFMNLQELLMHMDPALAGAIVPGVVLVLIAAVPYIDNDGEGAGVWFTTMKGRSIAKFSFIYATVWNVVLILFNEFIGTTYLFQDVLGLPRIVPLLLFPAFVLLLGPALLVVILRKYWQANTREVIIGLFTVFAASYLVLTIVGTAFRGPDMRLFWPWALPPTQ